MTRASWPSSRRGQKRGHRCYMTAGRCKTDPRLSLAAASFCQPGIKHLFVIRETAPRISRPDVSCVFFKSCWTKEALKNCPTSWSFQTKQKNCFSFLWFCAERLSRTQNQYKLLEQTWKGPICCQWKINIFIPFLLFLLASEITLI